MPRNTGNPLPFEAQKTADAKARRARSQAQAKDKATDYQWAMVDMGIREFMKKYPREMKLFFDDLKSSTSKYAEADKSHKELRNAAWRNTASFPVIYKRTTAGELFEADSLLPYLKRQIPGLTNKKSKNYAEFLRRYPEFSPAHKLNISEF